VKEKTMEYNIYRQKRFFNAGIYVDRADDKIRTLLHDSKASENKFHYFCKNSCATTRTTFQRAIICQQKIKQLTVEEELYQFSGTGCTRNCPKCKTL